MCCSLRLNHKYARVFLGLEVAEYLGAVAGFDLAADDFVGDAVLSQRRRQNTDRVLKRHEHQHLVGRLVDDLAQHVVPVLDVELQGVAIVGVDRAAGNLQQLVGLHGCVDRSDFLVSCLKQHLLTKLLVIQLLLWGQLYTTLGVDQIRQVQTLFFGEPDGGLQHLMHCVHCCVLGNPLVEPLL